MAPSSYPPMAKAKTRFKGPKQCTMAGNDYFQLYQPVESRS